MSQASQASNTPGALSFLPAQSEEEQGRVDQTLATGRSRRDHPLPSVPSHAPAHDHSQNHPSSPTLPPVEGTCHYPHLSPACLNPEGIPSISPGLRVGELPWVVSNGILFNPEGVAAGAGFFLGLAPCDRCFNPFRVGESLSPSPRVARPSQPWAECSNPFRIEETARRNMGNDKVEVEAADREAPA
jgi:hypothetical protein